MNEFKNPFWPKYSEFLTGARFLFSQNHPLCLIKKYAFPALFFMVMLVALICIIGNKMEWISITDAQMITIMFLPSLVLYLLSGITFSYLKKSGLRYLRITFDSKLRFKLATDVKRFSEDIEITHLINAGVGYGKVLREGLQECAINLLSDNDSRHAHALNYLFGHDQFSLNNKLNEINIELLQLEAELKEEELKLRFLKL